MSRYVHGFLRIGSAAACLLSVTAGLHAQGTFNALQTGGGQSLVTGEAILQVGALTSPVLLFDFGFLTDELSGPHVFLDSFTVTVQNPAGPASAVLATIDASGTVWAPTSPGNLVLADSQIQRQPIAPPSLQPVLGRGVAFSVALPLPPELIGATLKIDFDLFDNQNNFNSLGWYNNLQIVSVPEPGIWVLVSCGLGALAILRKRAR